MRLLTKGDKVGIVACSNGVSEASKEKIELLNNTLKSLELNVVMSRKIYKHKSPLNSTGKERAEILMDFFCDDEIKAILDISGGDLCNEILEYLDYGIIKDNSKPFFGYSDLSVVLNALYSKTDMKTYLYQIRNIIGEDKEEQMRNFKDTIMDEGNLLKDFSYKWIQGESMEGIVVGGNIRCLLKLAGTEYMPDFNEKILFLESFSGDVYKMTTYLTQYKHMGVFKKIKGIILGSYTEMERENYSPDIVEIVRNIVDNELMPIIKTNEIGHGKDSKCIVIGEKIILNKED
ncbi:MAG: LD-carboxypeptidase [Clostridium sp.]|nr:LD-carboxypeptidase [Clostridium sp.]